MDIFIPIALFIVFFILFSICGWCCKRKHQGVVFGQGGTPITVTNQPVSASPVVIPPYPLDPHHPVPQHTMHPPAPGFAPTGGYPPVTGGAYPPGHIMPGMDYPSAQIPGYPPTSAPYPPQTAPPPSYHEAVMQPPTQPIAPFTNEGYSKQAPYNPNY